MIFIYLIVFYFELKIYFTFHITEYVLLKASTELFIQNCSPLINSYGSEKASVSILTSELKKRKNSYLIQMS